MLGRAPLQGNPPDKGVGCNKVAIFSTFSRYPDEKPMTPAAKHDIDYRQTPLKQQAGSLGMGANHYAAKPRQAVKRKFSGGRPTRDAAALRDQHLLAVATALFLERGFDATSIDAVAKAAHVSKPTVYAQYQDKRGLFSAVLRQQIGQFLAPLATAAEMPVSARSKASVERTLIDLGRKLQAITSGARHASVRRILAAQAANFPELALLAHEEGWSKAVKTTARFFDHLVAEGVLELFDSEIAAENFLNIVMGHTTRFVHYGIAIDPKEQDRRLRLSIRMLLTGFSAKAVRALGDR